MGKDIPAPGCEQCQNILEQNMGTEKKQLDKLAVEMRKLKEGSKVEIRLNVLSVTL